MTPILDLFIHILCFNTDEIIEACSMQSFEKLEFLYDNEITEIPSSQF